MQIERSCIAVLLLFAALACRSSTAPAITRTHPQGVLATRVNSINGRPFGIAVSRSGVVYVTQQDVDSVTRVDLPAGTVRAEIGVGQDPGDVRFNSAGSTAYVSDYAGGSVHAISVGSSTVTGTVHLGSNAYRLALSPDEHRLYVSSIAGSVYVVNPATLTVSATFTVGGALQGLALSSTGAILYVASTSGTIYALDSGTGAIRASVAVGGTPQDVALSPDGSRLYAANEAGWVDVIDASSLTRSQRFSVTGAFGLAVTPDGSQLYVTTPNNGSASPALSILDAATGSFLGTPAVGGTPRRVAFDATGATAVVANEGGWVDIVK